MISQFMLVSCLAHSATGQQQESPKVGQNTDNFDDFYVPAVPFSETERFQYFDSFIIGFKLADTYD